MKMKRFLAYLLTTVLVGTQMPGMSVHAENEFYKTEEYGIFDMGDYDSFNYRIPALTTTKDGVVIAAADQRNDHWSDWGNIDTVIRRSKDQGLTWEEPIEVIDLKSQPYDTGTQSAFLIDPVMIPTESGRVWMLVDMFPESTGFNSISKTGTGYVTAEDGERYLALYQTVDGQEVLAGTLRGSYVYDLEGNKTEYTVDMGSWQDAYNTKGDMYQNGEYVGNIYLTSKGANNISAPMHVFKTIYLWLTYSNDNGETWSNPVSISDQVKEEWMKFCGTGPGVGIEVQNGEYKGRLIFPIYYTETSGFQSTACVYSDDGGITWKRGESPNDGRINSSGQATNSQNPSGISQLTESQIIELNNGHLLQFMRNYGGAGKVAVARSTDGGATWEDPYNTDATEVYCQLSVIHYPETVDVNGDGTKDEIIIMSNPGGSGRNNGTLRIGVIGENDSITWVNTKMFCAGNYAYSCLSYMGDGKIGLLYEHNNTIKFTSFDLEYIQSAENITVPNITSVTCTVEKTGEHENTLPGDALVFTATISQEVEVKGNPQFRFKVGTENRYADFVSYGDNQNVLVYKYVVQEGDAGSMTFKGPKIVSDAENYAKNSNGYSVSSLDTDMSFGTIGGATANGDTMTMDIDLPLSSMTTTTGSFQNQGGSEGPLSLAFDNNAGTWWHTKYAAGHNRAEHWVKFDLGKEYPVSGLRYLPRQTGGSNGLVTGYEILVSDDGTNFRSVTSGSWASDTSWKRARFDEVQNVRYVKFQVTDAGSVEADNDYATAAELRITIVAEHTCEMGTEWVANATQHYHACNVVDGCTEKTDVADHTYGDYVTVKKPGCATTGLKVRTCTECGYEDEEQIAVKGHAFGEWTVSKVATCTKPGVIRRECSICKTYEEDVVVKTEHPFGEWTESKAPTCTKAGEETRTCSVCGGTETRVGAEATGHSFGEWTESKAPTCEKAGEETRTCSVCGGTEKRTGEPKTGHSYGEWVVEKAPTCTRVGKETKTCSACGKTEAGTIDALGHAYASEYTEDVAATCTQPGSKSIHCTREGCTTKKELTEIPALGHSFSDWTVSKAVTCTEAGKEIRTCSVCKETETKVLSATGHKMDAGTITKAATCVAGEKTYKCTNAGCTHSTTEVLPAAKGHTWDKGKVTAPTETKKGYKTYTCTVCKETKKATVELKKGNTFVAKDDATYKITKAGKNGTVSFVKTKSKVKTIVIPTNVKIAGVNYKVTAIEKNAFKNNKTATKIVVDRNITKIGATAFKDCKKLKEIQIRTTLLKKGSLTKTTFKGVKTSVKVTVPSSKVKVYKTLFRNAGLNKKVKITK